MVNRLVDKISYILLLSFSFFIHTYYLYLQISYNKSMKRIYLSIIVPVYNEAESIPAFVKRLCMVMKDFNKPFEVIFVNDGSSDKSEEKIKKICKENSMFELLSFTRNFGQTAAFAAGFDFAKGKVIATIDADLQNDPKDILKMLKLMNKKKADIVTGWRKTRKDPFIRSFFSKAANWIILKSMKSPVHDTGCSLKLYKRETVKNLQLYGEMHRFIPILAVVNGAKIVEMVVTHHARAYGQSKYGLNRMFKVLLDLITLTFLRGFQTKPIYMFGFAGLWSIFFGILLGIFVAFRHFFFQGDWLSPLFIISTIMIVFGMMSISMGLLAEIQVRTWYESSGKKSYVLKR